MSHAFHVFSLPIIFENSFLGRFINKQINSHILNIVDSIDKRILELVWIY